MTLRVVVSFDYRSKDRGIWLADELKTANYDAVTEDSFGAESPRREMTRAIEQCDVVVALLSSGYPDSQGAQRELDLAEAHNKPVIAVFTDLVSRSVRARPYAAYRRIEVPSWRGTDEQWGAALSLLLQALGEQRRRMPIAPVLDRQAALATERAYLLYDIEDRALAFRVFRARPDWQPLYHGHDADESLPRVLLWTNASAEQYSLAGQRFDATSPDVPAFLLRTTDAPTPLKKDRIILPVDMIVGGQRAHADRPPQAEGSARDDVERLLEEVRERNDGIWLDVFTERFCGSYGAAAAAEEAYRIATSHLPAGNVARLRAVHQHALSLRFYGDWRVAVGLIADELQALPADLPEEAEGQRLRLILEQLNVEYELGEHLADDADQQVRRLQQKFSSFTDLHGYVQAGRVLGNVLREQGDFPESERVLQRTIGVAEYLAEQSNMDDGSKLLLADCHRELAGLFIARHDIGQAVESLREARGLISPLGDVGNAAKMYLTAALDYVDATLVIREDKLIKVTTPTEQAHAALETLASFGNPIRVAAVYDWLGQAWTRQMPQHQEDLLRGEAYLRKALRIRESHGHSYTCGLSHLSLGKLYGVTGDLSGEIWHYAHSQEIFQERGVQPGLARAHAALARAYFRKFRSGEDDARQAYQLHLVSAEELYREINLGTEGIELRYELEHGGRHAVDEVADDTPLVAVGEYLLHRWIRDYVASLNPPADPQFELTLGIGDDAAVLTPKGIEPDHCLVFTTDSAPGSLSKLERSPAYVGRFAVVQTLSDVIAMGARPVGLLVNIFLSRAATVGYVKQLIDAVAVEARRYGVPVVGGDVKERYEQSIGCVGIGIVDKKKILTRSAAQPGHIVGITLAADPSGSGARLIGARWAQELIEHYKMNNQAVLRQFPALADLVDESLKYDLLVVPTTVMASAASTGRIRAAIDTSDGVLACLEIIGRESDVGFELDESMIIDIIDGRAHQLAGILEVSPATFLFSAGHDWEIVFTCAAEDFPAIATQVERDLGGGGRVAPIGVVTERQPDSAVGVQLRRLDGAMDRVMYYTDEKFVPRNYQDRPGQWLGFASHLRPIGERH